MSDPYKVLGLTRDASEDDIKRAYRKLSRKYHPDANINNPDKDKAEEMFKLVQQAYEQIMYEREHPYARSDEGSYSYGYGSSSGRTYRERENPYGSFGSFGPFGGAFWSFGNFGDDASGWQDNSDDQETIRLRAAYNYIQNGRYREALNALDAVPERTARWYYLSALANAGYGNNLNAIRDAEEAVRMEPSNNSYRQLLNSLKSGSGSYRTRQTMYGGAPYGVNANCSRLCTVLCLSQICCGGGMPFIFCC